MALGTMKISTQALEHVLHLPDGYKVVAVQQERGYGDTLNILLESDAIAEPKEDEHDMPDVNVQYSVGYLADVPHEYRKITAHVDVKHRKKMPHELSLFDLV